MDFDKLINTVLCGKNEDVMPTIATGSIDTVITDPPYGWSFMGKGWDYEVPSVAQFEQILRVLKPGGTMLCFAGSRTQHRMAVNVEDAGFILKDCIMWLYGSGFPKATDISKQIDKQAGVEREVVGHDWSKYRDPENYQGDKYNEMREEDYVSKCTITQPATPEALLWDGWKSHGLKPAYEPIIVAMKCNDGSYANNAIAHGVAGLNIDAGRIAAKDGVPKFTKRGEDSQSCYADGLGGSNRTGEMDTETGRFPANVILDEQAAAMLDEQSGERPSCSKASNATPASNFRPGQGSYQPQGPIYPGDSGGASRFFYCAKASKSERNEGCEGLAEKDVFRGNHADNPVCQMCRRSKYDRGSGVCQCESPVWQVNDRPSKNHHPTVKPLALMEYLCKLTSTPTGGIVLDPFAGSGTTLLAAYNTGRDYIGIERDPEYVKIIKARLANAKDKLGLFES